MITLEYLLLRIRNFLGLLVMYMLFLGWKHIIVDALIFRKFKKSIRQMCQPAQVSPKGEEKREALLGRRAMEMKEQGKEEVGLQGRTQNEELYEEGWTK